MNDGSFELHQRYYLHMTPKLYGRRMQHPSLFYQWQHAKLDIEKERRWESNYEVPSTKNWGYKIPFKTKTNLTPQPKTLWDTPKVLRESHFRYFECLDHDCDERDQEEKD